MAEGGKDADELTEVVVTPTKQKTFGDLYQEMQLMSKDPTTASGLDPSLASAMIELLKASGHLETSKPTAKIDTKLAAKVETKPPDKTTVKKEQKYVLPTPTLIPQSLPPKPKPPFI